MESHVAPKKAAEVPENGIDPVLLKLLEGKYTVECQIGHGAQGNVYKGTCIADGQRVAIKQLRVNSAKNWKQYELFSREAEILSKLHVKGTAKFYEAIQALDSAHPMSVIVQEYIDGRSLQAYLDSGSRFEFAVTCRILLQLLDILERLHYHNPMVIHRDLKPSNILLRYNDDDYSVVPEVFVIDFGAVANPQVQDGGSTVTGTYGYMAPEQLVGKPVPGSDIYSFAVIAVYMLSGVPPEEIQVQDLQLLIDPHLEHLPHTVTAFLRMMLDKSPATRLVDYRKIRQALTLFQKHDFQLEYLANTRKAGSGYSILDVNSVVQAGNVAIWYDLSDETPRKIPPEYESLFHSANEELRAGARVVSSEAAGQNGVLDFETDHESYYVRFGYVNLMQREFGKHYRGRHIAHLGCFFTLVLATLIVFVIFIYQLTKISLLTMDSFYIRGFIFVLWILASVTAMAVYYKRFEVWNKNYTKQFQSFFAHARKSLARIEDVRLISGVEAFNMANALKDVAQAHETILSQRSQIFNTHVRPIWEIKYSFNPPDDKNPAPITHVYYSDVFIEHCKIGDTLPILYGVHYGDVYSMPYPLPLSSSILQCPNLVSMFGIHIHVDARQALFKY